MVKKKNKVSYKEKPQDGSLQKHLHVKRSNASLVKYGESELKFYLATMTQLCYGATVGVMTQPIPYIRFDD